MSSSSPERIDETDEYEDLIWVISLRKANRKERLKRGHMSDEQKDRAHRAENLGRGAAHGAPKILSVRPPEEDAAIHAAALRDPDAQPLTEEELAQNSAD